MNSEIVTVVLSALCGVELALIWQVSTLADKVHDLDEDMRATAKWYAHMEANRFWMTGWQEDGGDDGTED